MPARTYQDLLKNPYDEQLFDYYFTAQLVRIKEGAVYEIGNRQSTAVHFHYPQINHCYLSRQSIAPIHIKYQSITSHKSSRS